MVGTCSSIQRAFLSRQRIGGDVADALMVGIVIFIEHLAGRFDTQREPFLHWKPLPTVRQATFHA
jgi:hypothetical protein